MTISRSDFEFFLKHDLMSFIERSFYELNPQTTLISSTHLEVLAAELDACRKGLVRRLIINLPPRSLKSHCVSISFPAFLLGHNPAAQIICASYGQDLSDKLARDCRTIITSSFYQRLFPHTILSAERQAVSDFMTTAQGFRMATSVGGVLTGRGGDFLILDDPLKPEDALSETRRTGANNWYDNTLLSRLNSKEEGVIIVVMQRLHQDDLVGHVLEQGNWQVLSFPAVAEEGESYQYETLFGVRMFKRARGEALQPEREGIQTLATIRSNIGEYNFASQYQQSPIPAGGAMVKTDWLRYYDSLPSQFTITLQSWDTANKSGELNDFSVCTTWGVFDGHYYLLHVFRRRMNYPELKRAVHEQSRQYKATTILIEDRASGTQLIQDLKKDGVCFIKPYEPPPATDKILRLHAQTAEFENGRVLLPRSAPWLADYVQELTSFPGSKYDDQVDSTSQALDYLKTNRSTLIWAKLGEDYLAEGGLMPFGVFP
jgi:predicted phage terminase large subunit-like protein